MSYSRYGNFVDGFCFRGVWGFTAIVASYVAAAVLTLFLVILVHLNCRIGIKFGAQGFRGVFHLARRCVPNQDVG